MPKPAEAPKSDRPTQLALAALHVLARKKWPDITLAAVARAAKLRLPEVLAIAPSKSVLPGLILRSLTRKNLLTERAARLSDDPRERLFDVTMSWFDTQQSHASSLKNLYRALQFDPATLLAMRGDIVGIAGELLAMAEADFGLLPIVQAGVFAIVLVRATSIWRNDDEEMGKTMAQLANGSSPPGTLHVAEAVESRETGKVPAAQIQPSTLAVPDIRTAFRSCARVRFVPASLVIPAGGWRRAARQAGSHRG